MAIEKQFLSRQSVAAFFDISPLTVDRWVKAGVIPGPTTIGGTARWSVDALMRAAAGAMDKASGGGALSADADSALEAARDAARKGRAEKARRRNR